MKYNEYRQKGLPITSSPIESTIKQINRRIKGTEKFWADGADPMLHLVADRLSQTNVTDKTLGTLKKHPTLKSLILTGTRVSSTAVNDFERGTPNCKVTLGSKR